MLPRLQCLRRRTLWLRTVRLSRGQSIAEVSALSTRQPQLGIYNQYSYETPSQALGPDPFSGLSADLYLGGGPVFGSLLHLCLYDASCYFTRGLGPCTQLGLDGVNSIYLSKRPCASIYPLLALCPRLCGSKERYRACKPEMHLWEKLLTFWCGGSVLQVAGLLHNTPNGNSIGCHIAAKRQGWRHICHT